MKHKIIIYLIIVIYTLLQYFGIVSKDTVLQNFSDENIIKLDYRGHLYFYGKIDNIDGLFVFDTGAHSLYIDSLFYNTNNFNHDSIMMAKLPGVGEKPQDVKVIRNNVNFNFGANVYTSDLVPIFSLKTILGDDADGILGLDYFSKSILEINYNENYMKVHNNISSIDISKYKKIQGEIIERKLYIPLTIRINDHIIITNKYMVDLGSASPIDFTSPIAENYNLKNSIKDKVKYYTKYGGVSGYTSNYEFWCKSINIGGYELKDFNAAYSIDKNGALATSKHAGLLGNGILDRFDIIIDFANANLYIKPNNKFNEEFKVSKLGFSFVDRYKTYGAWVVTGFYENSPAEKSGLRIDDKIIMVNNIFVKDIKDYKQKIDILKEIGDTLKLKIERQSQIFDLEIKLKPVI